ncbi:DNA cytosine methyltransferase [Vibrio cholerae]
MRGIDLFAGAGGTTTGAKDAGVDIVWAVVAVHSPKEKAIYG